VVIPPFQCSPALLRAFLRGADVPLSPSPRIDRLLVWRSACAAALWGGVGGSVRDGFGGVQEHPPELVKAPPPLPPPSSGGSTVIPPGLRVAAETGSGSLSGAPGPNIR